MTSIFFFCFYTLYGMKGEVDMSVKTKMKETPIIEHPLAYFIVVLVFLLLLRTPILMNVSNPEFVLMGYFCLFLLFSVTIGFKEFQPFYNKGNGMIDLIKMTGAVFIACLVMESLVSQLLSASDPQLLNQYSFHLSWNYVIHELSHYSLVGIGEEIFKFSLFLWLYWFGMKLSGKRLGSCILAVFLTSLLFGLLHINYNYEQWFNITVIIGLSAVIYFYFLFKYQTILPLMLAHGLQDFLVSLELTEELSGIYTVFLYVVLAIFLVSWFIGGIRRFMRR